MHEHMKFKQSNALLRIEKAYCSLKIPPNANTEFMMKQMIQYGKIRTSDPYLKSVVMYQEPKERYWRIYDWLLEIIDQFQMYERAHKYNYLEWLMQSEQHNLSKLLWKNDLEANWTTPDDFHPDILQKMQL